MSPPEFSGSAPVVLAQARQLDEEFARNEQTGLPQIVVSRTLADACQASQGDLIYISDPRWWLGGLRSCHAIINSITDDGGASTIFLGDEVWQTVVPRKRESVSVQVLY